MIKKALVAAVVFLLKVVAETYFPEFPITEELINSFIMALLAWLSVDVVELTAKKAVAKMRAKSLW